MAIDARHLLEGVFAELGHACELPQVDAFAQGCEPLDECSFRFVQAGGDGSSRLALPTSASALACPGAWAREPDRGIDWRRHVQAERQGETQRPLPAKCRVIGHRRGCALWVQGTGKGVLPLLLHEFRDSATGAKSVSVTPRSMLRGIGSFGIGAAARHAAHADVARRRLRVALQDVGRAPGGQSEQRLRRGALNCHAA